MRILVCGGRDYGDLASLKHNREHPLWNKREKEYRHVFKTLDSLMPPATDDMDTWLPPQDTVIIQGGARGADSCAHDWAVCNWVKQEEYPVDWGKYGKRAGFIRNTEMLEKGKPELVVAFPGGKGTAMMVNISKRAGIKVIEVDEQLHKEEVRQDQA